VTPYRVDQKCEGVAAVMAVHTEITLLLVCGDQYEHGDDQTLAAVVRMMPNKVKRRRKIQTESGVSKQLCEFCLVLCYVTLPAKFEDDAELDTCRCSTENVIVFIFVFIVMESCYHSSDVLLLLRLMQDGKSITITFSLTMSQLSRT